jgi:hypothetical protein
MRTFRDAPYVVDLSVRGGPTLHYEIRRGTQVVYDSAKHGPQDLTEHDAQVAQFHTVLDYLGIQHPPMLAGDVLQDLAQGPPLGKVKDVMYQRHGNSWQVH